MSGFAVDVQAISLSLSSGTPPSPQLQKKTYGDAKTAPEDAKAVEVTPNGRPFRRPRSDSVWLNQEMRCKRPELMYSLIYTYGSLVRGTTHPLSPSTPALLPNIDVAYAVCFAAEFALVESDDMDRPTNNCALGREDGVGPYSGLGALHLGGER